MAHSKNLTHLERIRRHLNQSYLFAIIVLIFVMIGAIDWLWHRGMVTVSKSGESQESAALTPTQVVLQQAPWKFFHPIWEKPEGWSQISVDPKDVSKLPTPDAQLSEFVADPDKRIEDEFAVSPGMRKRVLFWMEIYAKYSSRFKVVHDREDPGIIYGVIDLRPLYRIMPNNLTAEIKGAEIERKIITELKAHLSEAIGLTRTNDLSPQERDQIRSFLSETGSLGPSETRKLIENVRSQTGQRDMFLQALFRSANLLPHIESVFRTKGLPSALARIPFVESSFNVKALSNVGAVGIWQFMPDTAKQMIRSGEGKMWSDPLRQTASAARLFQIYRSMLPDWGTTITSYNSGVGRVRRLCGKYRVKGVEGLLNIPNPDGLGFAGQNFYAEFLAANLVEAYKEKIFSKLLAPVDLSLVFRGIQPFPKDICDL